MILYVPSTIFQLNRDGSSWVEPVLSYDKCVLLKDHNTMTPVRIEPAAPETRVKHSTTEPLRSLESGIRCNCLSFTLAVSSSHYRASFRFYIIISVVSHLSDVVTFISTD